MTDKNLASHNHDTIAAVATPAGAGGVGIIRVSGSLTRQIAEQVVGNLPTPRYAKHSLFKNQQNETLDDGIALFFPAPHSFTGEDVLELQGHGGQVVLDMLLNECITLGARMARPGEFSERAFLNDKLDLAQAEAIADLIEASSEKAVKSALKSLQGDFSEAINDLLKQLINLRIYVEAALDFPDEEIDFLADNSVIERLEGIKSTLNKIFAEAKQGQLLREGMTLVIAGKPNAGKSSLLNALSGQETAIVTDIAGTTRDIVKASINLDGMPLHVIDTAGLRESDDVVEQIGIQRAWDAIENADHVLLLIDDNESQHTESLELIRQLPVHLPILKVFNKIDLSGTPAGQTEKGLYLSAKQKIGIDILKNVLKKAIGYQSQSEGTFSARRRHIQALEQTQDAVERAEMQLREFNAGELMAEELRLAQDYLGSITGRYTSDDLLGDIFSSFCIGK